MLKKILTKDGSYTFYNPDLKETFHSKNGALTESLHVYISEGLEYWIKNNSKVELCNIFEMGFGLGFNAYSTLDSNSIKNIKIEYNTIEVFPVEFEVIKSLNFNNYKINRIDLNLFLKLHSIPWGLKVNFNSLFNFFKINSKIENYNFTNKYDVILVLEVR